MKKKYKIAFLFICLNSRYWPYIGPMIESARKHFLQGHEVHYLLWSDMPSETNYGVNYFFCTEPVEWPLPTLMRYHLFLQQEEILKNYDYIFYADADMLFVDTVGDEILGEELTATLHPMYAFKPGLRAPFEPNPQSTAYIDMPTNYFAGGFQGGKTELFLKAMHSMKRSIDKDFMNNYMARWNDESHLNKYLFENPPSIILSPSYVYPDSLIKDYYEPIWGTDHKKGINVYPPKIITLTKPFSLSKEGGEAIKRWMENPIK